MKGRQRGSDREGEGKERKDREREGEIMGPSAFEWVNKQDSANLRPKDTHCVAFHLGYIVSAFLETRTMSMAQGERERNV